VHEATASVNHQLCYGRVATSDRRLVRALEYVYDVIEMCAPAAPPIRLPIPNPNINSSTHPNPNPIFNPILKNVFERKQKRPWNIGQHRVIFITYFPKGRGGFIRGP